MSKWKFQLGDAFDLLAQLEPDSIDCIITDYPYESLEKHRAIGTTTRLSRSTKSSNDWFSVIRNERIPELLLALYRVLKPNAHLYLFADDETSNHLWSVNQMLQTKYLAGRAGGSGQYRLKWWKRIVWDKGKIGMGYHYRSRYEFICFLEKGKRKLSNLGVPDVLGCDRVYRGYPAEKPVGVLRTLVEQSTLPGQLILDPFCGSGSTGEAALVSGRRFLGFDLSLEARISTVNRLHSCVLTLKGTSTAS